MLPLKKAYGGKRKISWMEVYAGEKATQVYDQDTWLPQETLDAVKDYVVSIKGPLTTPVGGGIRSLNVALRQQLDLVRLPAPSALVRRRAEPGQEAWRRRHDDLSRELRRHLRRYRVEGRLGRKPPK